MEDDDLCCDVKPWCQRGDYKSAFAINLAEPLFTFTDALQQSVLSTLKFPEVVAAKTVSVDGPVRVDNIDQHVRIRSEIIIPRQSILASLEDGQHHQECPESSRSCRDPVGSTHSDGSSDDECDDDDEEEDEDDDGEEEEESESCDDESNKDDMETQDDGEEDDDGDAEASMQQCSNTGLCRDPPKGKEMPQAPSRFPTELPVKKYQEATEKANTENEAKAECEAKETEIEVKKEKERTPEEEEELNSLHQQCLHLSKEELEAICVKYKAYDKRFRIKRAKSGQTGECKYKTSDKEKPDKGSVGGKQQEEAKTEEGDEYFCQEEEKEKSVVDVEEDEECEDVEEKEKENKDTEVTEKEADDSESEEYEEEDETERYYGLERPCKAAPIPCENPIKDKQTEPIEECVPRDYSRYDKRRNEEKEKDIFYKLSPKYGSKGNKQKNSNTVCDDDKGHGNKPPGYPNRDQCTESSNNKLAPQQATIYYDDNTKQETTANQKSTRVTKEGTETKQTTKEDVEYFACNTSEPQSVAKPEEIKPKLCSNEYYTPNINNNNKSDECQDDGGYFECSDDLVKDDDGDRRSEFVSSNGGFAYSYGHANVVEDNTNESCGVATAVGHRQYPKAQTQPQNGTDGSVHPLVSYSCPENSRNQQKYQAYGHSGDDDADERYFASTALLPGEDEKGNKTRRINFPILTDAARNSFNSGVDKSTSKTFSVDGLAIYPFEHPTPDVVSLTSDHFEQCKRVFESMKERAFGDDFEDYFESCVSSSLEDDSESNTTPPGDQIPPAPVSENKAFASVDEECEAKRNGFLKSLFGIIGKAGIKQNRKNGKPTQDCVTDTGDGCQMAKPKVVEKRFFNFGRYKEKNGEKASNKNGCDAKKSKESSEFLPSKSEKRKFRFGKTVNEKRQKLVDTAGMIESFLAIEKTANQYNAIDDNFEIKSNGYIFNCGKPMKRLHTGDVTGLAQERQRPCAEKQESGDVGRTSAAGKDVSEKASKATAAGDCDQSNEKYWGQNQDHFSEASDPQTTSHAERQDDTRIEVLLDKPELVTAQELAIDVTSGNAQTELLNKIPSVGRIRNATLMHLASETNKRIDLAGGERSTRKDYSAPGANSARVQIIVSDNMSNVNVLKPALCGFPVPQYENETTKQGQPKRKVSSFLVVSKAVDKNAQNDTKPYRQVIRRKIIEQEAVIISRHDKRCKECKSPAKQDKKEIWLEPTEVYRPKERRPEINYGKHIHESKSLSRTVFRDCCTAGHKPRRENKPGLHSNSATSTHEIKNVSLITKNEQKATKKYQESKNSRRNKSAKCLINNGPVIDPKCGHYVNEDSFENLKTNVSPYIASRSMHSTRAKSDTRLLKQKPNKSYDDWLLKSDLPDTHAGMKNSFRQKQFVNSSVQGERKTTREIYSYKRTRQVPRKVMYDGNHNVNCGADDEDDDIHDDYDDDFGNCQPQTVNNIIFSDKQQPVEHVRNKTEAVSREANQAFAGNVCAGDKVVWDTFILNETAEAGAISRENIQLEAAAGHVTDKVTGGNTPETEMSANKNNKEQTQTSTGEESIINDALNTLANAQIKTEAVNLESNPTSSEIMNAETTNFLLTVGDNTSGDIVESFLNEKGQKQKLYNGELGLIQDCSGSHWEIEPSLRDDYLIVNSKNENVIYSFQSENRPIWKSGEYDDLEATMHDASGKNINDSKYTKYDDIDDGRNGGIFDENQLMRGSHVKIEAVEDCHRQQLKQQGIDKGKRCQEAGIYAEVTSSGDKFVEQKPSRDPNRESPMYRYTRPSSAQDPNSWTTHVENDTNKLAESARPQCISCVGKAWRFADAFLKNGEEAKDGNICVDGAYTSQWSDGRKWQAANVCQENRCEDGKEREFWGDNLYSTVGNYGRTKMSTAVNIVSGVGERKETEFWNSAAHTSANNGEKAHVNDPGESKDYFWPLRSLADNTSDKTQTMGEELRERVDDEFWSDRLYSPTRKVKGNWKLDEGTEQKRANEVNTVHDSKINADANKTKSVPVRKEQRKYTSPEKVVEASKIKSNEAEIKADKERKIITKQYPSPSLLARQAKYMMKTPKSSNQSDAPEVIIPTKGNPPENSEKPVGTTEACTQPPCLKEKPIHIYDIFKPTVIKLNMHNAGDADKLAKGKEKRNNVNEAVKEKANNATETVKSSGFRMKTNHMSEANSAAITKDTKKSEAIRRTRHTGTSEAAKKMAEAKEEQKTSGKDFAARREKIGDWFSQEKALTSPNGNARRSTKRDGEESHSRETRFSSGGKQAPTCLLKPENHEPSLTKQGREANVARDKVNPNVSKRKTPFQSQSQENIKGENVIFVDRFGDGRRMKKWKLFVVSERKDVEGNAKHDMEPEPAAHHNVSKSRESNERVLLGPLNAATRQMAGKFTERPVSTHAEDDLNNRHAIGQSRTAVKAILSTFHRTEPRNNIPTVIDKKTHDSKTTKGSPEQPKKQGRVYKLDLGEHLKFYDHKKPVTINKDQTNTMEEFGFGQLVQLTSHSHDRDADKFKLALGKHDENGHRRNQTRVFKIDCEERVSNKSRNRTKDSTARKQKAEECVDNQPDLIEQKSRAARIVDKEEKDLANKVFFDRHHHRRRYQQKSETSVTKGSRVKVENSKSEVMSVQQHVDDNESAFIEEFKKSNVSRKEECKKWKEEIHRAKYKSENNNINSRRGWNAHAGEGQNPDPEVTHISAHPGYVYDSCQGDGLNQGEGESQQTQENSGESCVDVAPACPEIPHSFDEGRIEFDRRSKASSAKFDSDINKCPHKQSKENRRRQDAVKKSRTDTNQADRFVPTLIDSSVVNTVARTWMDGTEQLRINCLEDAKLFSPLVLLQQTSGSPSANCQYINSSREIINNPEITNQHNPVGFGGDYFDLFPRPTFLPAAKYQEMHSVEHDHNTSETEYAACKLCPQSYFDTYKNDADGSQQQQQQQQQQQACYSGDTQSSQDRDQNKAKNQEFPNSSKPYYHSTEKAPSGSGGAVSRSYLIRADKAGERRKHVSKDDSFILIGRSSNFVTEASVSKYGDKYHNRRTGKLAEALRAEGDQQTVKQAQERKSVDPRNIKKASDKSKHIRKIESADDIKQVHEISKAIKAASETSKSVKPASENARSLKPVSETSRSVKPSTETSKTVKAVSESSKAKTAQEHSKTEHAYSYKPQTENTQNSKTSNENQQGKGHMFSYKVSSKGNRPEVVKAEPKLVAQSDVDSPAGGVETVGAKLEAVRQETPQEPAQLGLFARILNTLTRATNNQVAATQPLKDTAPGKPEPNAAVKPDSNEPVNSSVAADGSADPKETPTSSHKNKLLRSRSPLLTRDAKSLRPDYKQNTNGNAFVEPSRPNLPIKHSHASSSKPLNKPNRQSIPRALTRGEACIASLTTALQWNAILLIVILALYLGPCCPGFPKRYLSCPLPGFWDTLYKYGLISLAIDAFLISAATVGPFAFGNKGPPTGTIYSFVGKHVRAMFGPLVNAATVLYSYVGGPVTSVFYHAVMKAIKYLLFFVIYTCNSAMYYFSKVIPTKVSRIGDANIVAGAPFHSASNQPQSACDSAFLERMYLKALNCYPAKCV
ncbi:hypothetical protein BsWGS_23747 [Bradybaena similaris]